jgi:hypothetical protein
LAVGNSLALDLVPSKHHPLFSRTNSPAKESHWHEKAKETSGLTEQSLLVKGKQSINIILAGPQ